MFGQRKHKTFNYKPRYSKKQEEGLKDDDVSSKSDFVTKWRQQTGNKVQMKGILPVRSLILLLVLLLICMYFINKTISSF